MESNEFRITGVTEGESTDAALHEPMLANEMANMMSQLAAITNALERGVTIERAADWYAGPLARARLIEVGALEE